VFNTFRFINAQGSGAVCQIPLEAEAEVHSLVWDEAQKIAGKDPDYHRRDIWNAIEAGNYPEYEFGCTGDRGEG
jgi:catalase